jgi:hypothetical protein
VKEILEKIARERLGIKTLEARKSDALDFHEIAVWNLKAALEAAYMAGQANPAQPSSVSYCESCGDEIPRGERFCARDDPRE